jgi:vacuolar protein-sorting-associated protein 4
LLLISRKNGGKKSEDKDDFKDKLAGAIVTEKPNIKWEDIAGLANAKAALKETVIMPARFPNIFE